jgi:hypothetical protein
MKLKRIIALKATIKPFRVDPAYDAFLGRLEPAGGS